MPFRRLTVVTVVTVVTVCSIAGVTPAVASSGPVVSAPCWPPPVAGAGVEVADPFRAPACRWCAGNRGIEYRVPPGTTVRAAATGVVTFAGVVAGTRHVVVRLANGWRITYGDLVSSRLVAGDRVVVGARVGRASGRFHLGVRTAGGYVDPEPHLARRVNRRRLVPADGSAARPAPPPRWECAAGPGGGARRRR